MPDVDFRSGSGRLVVAPVLRGFPPCARSCRAHGVGFCACRIRFRPGLPPSLIRPFSASWFPRFPGLRPAAVPRRGIASGKTRRRCAAVLFAGGGVRSRFRASDFRRPGETADFRRPADAPVGGIAVTSVIPWSLRRSFPSVAPSPRRSLAAPPSPPPSFPRSDRSYAPLPRRAALAALASSSARQKRRPAGGAASCGSPRPEGSLPRPFRPLEIYRPECLRRSSASSVSASVPKAVSLT